MKASFVLLVLACCTVAFDCAVAQFTVAPWIVNRIPTTTTTKKPWIFPNWIVNRESSDVDEEQNGKTTTKRPKILELLTGRPWTVQTFSPNISLATLRTVPPKFTLPPHFTLYTLPELTRRTIAPVTRRTLPPIYTRFTLPPRFTFPTRVTLPPRITIPPRTIRPFTIPPWFDDNRGPIDPLSPI